MGIFVGVAYSSNLLLLSTTYKHKHNTTQTKESMFLMYQVQKNFRDLASRDIFADTECDRFVQTLCSTLGDLGSLHRVSKNKDLD